MTGFPLHLIDCWRDYDLFLFDLDGTLITSYMENEDKDYHRWEFITGRDTAVQGLIRVKKKVGIVTNQAGVGLGYVEPREWEIKCGRVRQGLLWSIPEDMFFVCYGYPGKTNASDGPLWDPERRKPSSAMILEAGLRAGKVPLERILYVGDMDSDREAALAAGVDYEDAAVFFANP